MQISTETFGHVHVAHTPDELNDENTPSLIDALEAPIESGHVNIRSHQTIRHSVSRRLSISTNGFARRAAT